jgi:hypothetical protein
MFTGDLNYSFIGHIISTFQSLIQKQYSFSKHAIIVVNTVFVHQYLCVYACYTSESTLKYSCPVL